MQFTSLQRLALGLLPVILNTIHTSASETNDHGGISEGQRRVWVQYNKGEHDALIMSLNSYSTMSSSSSSPPVQFHYDFPESSTVVVTASEEEIELMRADPSVKQIQDDPKRYRLDMPGSLRTRHLLGQEIPYGIQLVKADLAWEDYNVRGSGVKVCVLDTGIDEGHEDFTPGQLSGKQGGSTGSWDVDIIGHGTHVSGTIAAADNQIGVVGVAPEAEIFTIKVFSDRDGSFAYASGIVDAAKQCQAAGAKIVSMSLGGMFGSYFESFEFEQLAREGILSVAAAGNEGGSSYLYPASYDSVVSVAALDSRKSSATFSQYNDMVDISAPGVEVLSTIPMNQWDCAICGKLQVGKYGALNGTSMAAPHVSGVAALLWSYRPDADVDEIRDALLSSAEDLGSPGKDSFYGMGLVSATNALAVLNGEAVDRVDPPRPINPPVDTPPVSCGDGEILVEVTVLADMYGNEISWEVKRDSDGFTVMTQAGLTSSEVNEAAECLPDDCYTFFIYDSRSDGICCFYGQGGYSVKVDGDVVASGGAYTDGESFPLVADCISKPVLPKPDPEDPPMPPPIGDGDCVPVKLSISTDFFPDETSVSLTSFPQQLGEDPVWSISGADEMLPFRDYEAEACLRDSGCWLFEIRDSLGNGICCFWGFGSYELVYGGAIVASGDAFGYSDEAYLGSGCQHR